MKTDEGRIYSALETVEISQRRNIIELLSVMLTNELSKSIELRNVVFEKRRVLPPSTAIVIFTNIRLLRYFDARPLFLIVVLTNITELPPITRSSAFCTLITISALAIISESLITHVLPPSTITGWSWIAKTVFEFSMLPIVEDVTRTVLLPFNTSPATRKGKPLLPASSSQFSTSIEDALSRTSLFKKRDFPTTAKTSSLPSVPSNTGRASDRRAAPVI